MNNLNLLKFFMFIMFLGFYFIEKQILKKENIMIKHHWLYVILLFSGIFLLYMYEKVDLQHCLIHMCTILCLPILIGQCVIDFKKMELSDINNIILFVLSLIYACLNNLQNYHISFSIIGISAVILYFLPISNMGFGDVKLLMATSLFVKTSLLPSYVFYMLLIALFIGIFYKLFKKSNIFPMGPSIAIMSFLIQVI